MANITLSAGAQAATSAPEKHVESYIKPAKGEIDSVVQADPDDKKARPDDWTRWRYEVSLATGKEAGGEGVPRTDNPTTFEQGEPEPSQPWRCSSCYAKRFETMCFGMNVAEAAGCQYCEKPRAKCGWTIWLHFSDLPPGWQANVTRQHGPKVVTLLATKWPGAGIAHDGVPPSV